MVAKQGELKAVTDEIGPLWDTKAVRLGTLKKPAMVVGAIGGGLILLYLLWSLLAATVFAAGLPSWVRYYVSKDTRAVVYFNVDTFRKTQVFEKLEGLLPSRSEMKRSSGPQICPEDVRDVYSLFQEDGSPITVLRTYEDLSISKIANEGEHDSRPEKYKGFEYIHFGGGYCQNSSLHVLHCAVRGFDGKNVEATRPQRNASSGQ